MNIIKPSVKIIRVAPIFICNKRLLHKTHYEVLGLTKDCSTKDVRTAYISLSKKHHPDNNKGKESHTNFVRIAEAYNVLSKPDKRRHYDWELTQKVSTNSARVHSTGYTRTGYGYDDPSFWRNRNHSQQYHHDEDCYYGIPGFKKLSNGFIASLCVIFTIICSAIQFYAIKHSYDLRQELLMKRSIENEKILQQVRTEAQASERNVQFSIMERRLLNEKFR